MYPFLRETYCPWTAGVGLAFDPACGAIVIGMTRSFDPVTQWCLVLLTLLNLTYPYFVTFKHHLWSHDSQNAFRRHGWCYRFRINALRYGNPATESWEGNKNWFDFQLNLIQNFWTYSRETVPNWSLRSSCIPVQQNGLISLTNS